MSKITPNSRLTFGQHKGMKLSDCADDYLKWIVKNLWNGEFHMWAVAAKDVLAERESSGQQQQLSLEEQADAMLKQAGYGDLTSDKVNRQLPRAGWRKRRR